MNFGGVRITSNQYKDAKTYKMIERFKEIPILLYCYMAIPIPNFYAYCSNLDMPWNKRRYPEIIRALCLKLLLHNLLSFLLVNIDVEDFSKPFRIPSTNSIRA